METNTDLASSSLSQKPSASGNNFPAGPGKTSPKKTPARRSEIKTGAAIYETNQIVITKAKRTVRKSRAPPIRNVTTRPHLTCPRCQRTFRAPIGLVGHLWTQCIKPPTAVIAASTSAPASTSTSTTSAPTFTNAALNPCVSLPLATTTSTTLPQLPQRCRTRPMGSSENPKRQVNKLLVPLIASSFPSEQPPPPLLTPPPTTKTLLTPRQPSTHSPSPHPPPAMLTRPISVLIGIAPSPHTSAWSVTCESIAERLES
ncbi:hypothetical protein SprV_0200867800 [Sparganum proliferum]